MAANDLLPVVPGISVSAASDDECDPRSDEHEHDKKDSPILIENSDSDLKLDYSSNEELSDEENNSGSKDVASELSTKLNDAEITDNDDSSFKAADIVGDKVLVERDGKFELVDVAEVKAEYFLMKGIDEKVLNQEEKVQLSTSGNTIDGQGSKKEKLERKKGKSSRPKTSPVKGSPNKIANSNRVVSASNTRKHNDEYSYIKSKYAMTEEQLEMKKRREEVIARRKKEEEERLKEEMERKREEAESAFQAWLKAKNEEYFEKRRLGSSATGEDKSKKEEAAKEAYDSWLHGKAKQRKQEKEMEKKRLEEEASTYVIRERQACEEAFRRWLQQKRLEERRKSATRKPKRNKKKRKMHKNGSLPVNSPAIRFTDYYGYSHTVSL